MSNADTPNQRPFLPVLRGGGLTFECHVAIVQTMAFPGATGRGSGRRWRRPFL